MPDVLSLLVGSSRALEAVRSAVARVAQKDVTVLLVGETGTGKELVARSLHALSHRQDGLFVPVNCAAVPEGLLESELFGHEKGSFTGADKKRIGKFEQAHGGILFLDEVGDIPLSMQVKLLRVLQERRLERVGGVEPVDIDVRLVSATHRNLNVEVAAGRFREDLLYRVNVIPITIPPLRDRPEDVPELAKHYMRAFARKHRVQVRRISRDTVSALKSYHWPGNVRELQNLIERAVIMTDGRELAFERAWFVAAPADTTGK